MSLSDLAVITSAANALTRDLVRLSAGRGKGCFANHLLLEGSRMIHTALNCGVVPQLLILPLPDDFIGQAGGTAAQPVCRYVAAGSAVDALLGRLSGGSGESGRSGSSDVASGASAGSSDAASGGRSGQPASTAIFMSAPLYRKLGSLESPADCLAVVEQPALPKLGEEDATIWRDGMLEPVLVLEEVQDPTNVGTMIRTADALGCRLVIGIGGAKPLSAKCVRASMGSAFALPIATAESSGEALGYLRERSCANIAAAATGEACDEVTYDFPAALWIGNEGRGLSAQVLREADLTVKIPMEGSAESLNAAAAAAILLWQLRSALRARG